MNLIDFFRADIRPLLPDMPDVSDSHFWFWRPKRRAANSHVCLVAHIDTVFPCSDIPPDNDHGILSRHTGLGADDRAGVYACLELRRRTGCMVLLTDLEERGGIGAHEAAMCLKRYLRQRVNFFIEIDRRGKNDMVFYNSEPDEFRKFIGGFGFIDAPGSFTDISILGRVTGVAGVNLSAGYQYEHTASEFLVVDYLMQTIDNAENILVAEKNENKKYHIGYTKPTYMGRRTRYGRWPESRNYLRPVDDDAYYPYADTWDGFPGD